MGFHYIKRRWKIKEGIGFKANELSDSNTGVRDLLILVTNGK